MSASARARTRAVALIRCIESDESYYSGWMVEGEGNGLVQSNS